MKNATLLFAVSVIAGLFGLMGGAACAESYPSRPVKIIVAWPAGGFVDAVTRAVADKLAADWSTTFIVENKPGAYGLIGTELVARSPADGYTWLIGTLSTPMSSSLYGKSWNAIDEFAGVAMVAHSPLIAVVPTALHVSSLKELVALARAKPGQINYLNPSIGSASHLNTELLKIREKIDLTSVPYNGQPPGLVDLLSGSLQFALLAPQVASPHVTSGKLKALAVAFPRRLPDYPDVPTLAEAGYPEADTVASYSILVPKKTPSEIVNKISAGVQKALADPEVRRRIERAGAEVAGPSTPMQVDAFLKAETTRWSAFFAEHPMSPGDKLSK